MARSVKEWIAKHDDQKVPASVRQRVYEKHKGICYLSALTIKGQAWDLDHITPLKDGGEHRENNLAPTLKKYHKLKTAREAAERVKTERTKQKHSGARRPKQSLKSRGFEKSEKTPKIDKGAFPELPRRSLYRSVTTS